VVSIADAGNFAGGVEGNFNVEVLDGMNYLIWMIYVGLLSVLLPHTQWMFAKFEAGTTEGTAVSWAAAVVFELTIVVLTHKLSAHIRQARGSARTWRRFKLRYANTYGYGLVMAMSVSTFANVEHAHAFAATEYSSPFHLVAFGGVLPIASLLFAKVLANVHEDSVSDDPDLVKAKKAAGDLRSQLRQAKQEVAAAVSRADAAESLVGIAECLFGDDKRKRILTARDIWQDAPGAHIATIADASPGYVAEVLAGANGAGSN